MDKITAFKTSDGQLFEKEAEAKIHEKCLTFDEWYSGNELVESASRYSVDPDDVRAWLLESRDAVLEFLK